MIRLVSWNIARRNLWDQLHEVEPDIGVLQEVPPPPPGCALEVIPGDAGTWSTAGWEQREWRTAVARLTDRVRLDARPTHALHESTGQDDWWVSRQGTIAAADVYVGDEFGFTAVSVYCPWERTPKGELYADASAHRILSDLTRLLVPGHRLVVCGDWNILLRYGEHGDKRFAARYAGVFDRAETLGLRLCGPAFPNGRRADPWPDELPADSPCVPTYHHNRQTPATATRQLDFVFASESIHDRVSTRALNDPAGWGGSDHCRVVIEVDI